MTNKKRVDCIVFYALRRFFGSGEVDTVNSCVRTNHITNLILRLNCIITERKYETWLNKKLQQQDNFEIINQITCMHGSHVL